MSVVVRGVKNAFRNKIRTGAIVLILAIGIGLALSMLVANQAVADKISQLKTEMGTALTINPAGGQGFEGGGDPLTESQLETIQQVAHVANVSAALNLRVQNEDSTGESPMQTSGTTSLESSIVPGESKGGMMIRIPEGFSMPLTFTGIDGTTDAAGTEITITEGRLLEEGDTNSALLGVDLAEKNNLTVGSTFALNDEQITVVGIFDQGTAFANAGAFLPLETAQQAGEMPDEISSMVATVDSIDNLESTMAAIESSLGEDVVDVTSSQQNVEAAIASLESVQRISIVGFVASLIAAGTITFMIMTVIVRERRREIGVIKAIGGGNASIVGQFMVEAMVLVTLGAFVGVGGALISSNGIANALVSTNASGAEDDRKPKQGTRMMSSGGPSMVKPASTADVVGSVATNIGVTTLLYGLLGTFAIAIIGSALPAWFIAKIRPAEVMRGE